MVDKMDPIWKATWLEALRSGEYKQGQGVLRDKDGKFCCLGVLSDLYAKVTPDAEWDGDYRDGCYALYTPARGHASVRTPPSVMEATGITSEGSLDNCYPNKCLDGEGTLNTLTGLNDNGYTFDEIADIVEENL